MNDFPKALASEAKEKAVVRDLIISPSQLESFRLCERKWYFKSVMKLPDKQHPAAAEGVYAHEQAEKRHRGEPFEELPHVMALVEANFLGRPKEPGVEIEITVAAEVAGVRMTGRIDILNTTGVYVDPMGVPRDARGSHEIGDMKYKNPRYWLSASGLRDDLQMNLYAHALLDGPKARFPARLPDGSAGMDFIRLSHLYASRSPPYDRAKVTVLRHREEVAAWVERVAVPSVEALRKASACTDVSQTRASPGAACRAFGGCAYEPVCTKRQGSEEIVYDLMASLEIRSKEVTKEDDVGDVFASLHQRRKDEKAAAAGGAAGGAAAGNGAQHPPLAAPTTVEAPAAVAASIVAAKVEQMVAPAPPLPAPAAASATDALFGDIFSTAKRPPAKAAAAAPVEAPPTPIVDHPAPAGIEVPTIAPIVSSAPPAPTPTDGVTRSPIVAAAPPTLTVVPPVEEKKRGRGRGRPRKDAATPETVEPTEPEAAAPEAEGVRCDATQDGIPVAPTKTGRFFYQDCLPSYDAKDLLPYLGAVLAKINEDFGVPDLRCGVDSSPLAFGKWKGVLAARIRKSPPPPTGNYYLLGVRGDEIKTVAADAIAQDPQTLAYVRGVS